MYKPSVEFASGSPALSDSRLSVVILISIVVKILRIKVANKHLLVAAITSGTKVSTPTLD
jgi:hypothetical protein